MKLILFASIPAWVILYVALFFVTTPVLAAECVRASWYGSESGNRTADGTPFDGTQMVAAHRTMKFGTKLRVTYLGRSAVVRIADRGPFIKGRSLDLSRAAAAKIGMIRAGVATVCYEILG